MTDKNEINDSSPRQWQRPELSPTHQEALDHFVFFWGEMASSWGINRTMAQIHALLYAMEYPLDTDTIMERLQISRGNASMNLRSLLKWKLIEKVPVVNSRRDFYTAEKDVWKITSRIIREREQREIKPVMQQLQESRNTLIDIPRGGDCKDLPAQERYFCERIDRLIELMKVFEGISRALIPFIDSRNPAMVRQLIQIAIAMHSTQGPFPDDKKVE